MKTLYLDCGMGAAGDMLAAALFELLDDKEGFIHKMNTCGIPGVRFIAEPSVKCGITGTHFRVLVDGVEEPVLCPTSSASEEAHHHEHGGNDHDHDHHHKHGGNDDVHVVAMHDHDHHHEHGDDEHDHHHDHDHEHHHEHGDDDHEHHHDHGHTHVHRSMAEIEQIIGSLALSERVKQDALEVYRLIAEAESAAHGKPVTEIHFHEVGTMDAIADVTAVCQLVEQLDVERILASPVHVGCGKVRCAHGVLPVPAPATAFILKGVPMYGGRIEGELCTPTGAALLKKFVSSYGEMPPLKVEKIGYGMGTKDFEVANCVRALLAETVGEGDMVVELSCNLDDMTPERIGFAMERLFEAGALDVYTVPVGMKKSRPGVMLCVMCREAARDEMIRLVFQHTTTLGVRETRSRRYTLQRSIETRTLPCGEVRVKRSEGYGVTRCKVEYEDLARIAREKGVSIEEAGKLVEE